MISICTRTEYAERLGLSHNMITQWVKAGKIGPPALRADGTVDVAAADQMLLDQPGIRDSTKQKILDLRGAVEATDVTSTGRVGPRLKHFNPETPTPEPHVLQLNKARALTALVAAERARRQLEEERGKYIKTEKVEQAWSRGMTEIVNQIEFALPALDRELAVDRQGMAVIRDWWRKLRQDISKSSTTTMPLFEYVEDENAP
jgi:hypothetical protein